MTSILSGSRTVRTYPEAREAAHAPGNAERHEQRDDRRPAAPSAPRIQLLLSLVVLFLSLASVLAAVLSGLAGAHGHHELGFVLLLRQRRGGFDASARGISPRAVGCVQSGVFIIIVITLV